MKSSTEEQQPQAEKDPVLLMLGVGKQLWEEESGDSFVDRLRSEVPVAGPHHRQLKSPPDMTEVVWKRIKNHQGEEFRTSRGLPFTYQVEGAGIWFWRDAKRINRKLTRSQVELGIARCPLTSTTEIKDLMDYAYLFGLLTDRRIRGEAW